MSGTPAVAPDPNRILSPWADRYGVVIGCYDPVFRKGAFQHSGFAPERMFIMSCLIKDSAD